MGDLWKLPIIKDEVGSNESVLLLFYSKKKKNSPLSLLGEISFHTHLLSKTLTYAKGVGREEAVLPDFWTKRNQKHSCT